LEFGGERKRRLWRVENMGNIVKSFTFLENVKLMIMINIFLILRTL